MWRIDFGARKTDHLFKGAEKPVVSNFLYPGEEYSTMVDRAYISASNKANIICKRYERKKTVDVSKFVGTGRTVKINCTCSYGHKLTSISDKVDLPGIYEHLIDKTVIAKAGVSLSAE